MMLRRIVFWLHLLTALTAGTVILVMAATGVLLAFEPQIVDLAEARICGPCPRRPADASRVRLAKLVAAAQEARGGERASTIACAAEPHGLRPRGLRSRRDAVHASRHRARSSVPARAPTTSCTSIEDWHRWLGSRDLGRPFTGVCNLAFLGLAMQRRCFSGGRGRGVAGPLRAITVPDLRAARQGARLQLAQQHRLLVRAGDHRAHGHGRRHVLSVGERSALSVDRQPAAAGRRAPPVPRRGGPRRRAARRRRAATRSAGGAPSIDLDALARARPARRPGWVALTAALPQRPGGPVTAFIQEPPRLASEPALGPHARRRHRPGRALGAVRRRQPRTQAARSCASCTPARSAA